MASSRHAGFFASLQRVEDRLALEKEEQQPSTDSMTAASSPLVLLDHPATTTAADSSGPALDFLTLTRHEYDERTQETEEEEEEEDDIERLMALLGLSPPRDRDVYGGGCDCSGAGGFLAKVVGVIGPKRDRERRRLDAWIQHFYHGPDGRREPARLAHLLLARADADGPAFPATVKEFLDRDAPSSTD